MTGLDEECLMSDSNVPARSRAIDLLLFIALVCSGLVFGLTLTHVLQDPGSRGLDATAWLDVQHTFYGGFAVIGGVGEIGGLFIAGAMSVALFTQRVVAGGVRAGIAALCFLGMLLAYFFGNRPVNAAVAGWTTRSIPADWSAYRNAWEVAHAASAVLAAAAFALLAVSAVWGCVRAQRASAC